ncbi:MAG: ThiF family adenylyltransferase [Gemmatimonadetes bacterium]|nr:ThiF family adenylyltransferase [Gemmatimonadota bacterium]
MRVVGKRLAVSLNPALVAQSQESQVRTVSFWGDANQRTIASLTVAIIGLGSVGAMVAELLARTGVRRLILIDYDIVKVHNLDRTISAAPADVGRPKVEVAAVRLRAIATAADFEVQVVDASVVERDGFSSVLDADVTFSCVDRPWARHVLNRAAYSHLIPVIDGGILVLFRPGGKEMQSANWTVHAAGIGRPCLICQRAYTTDQVSLEQTGLLESETYIQGLPDDSPVKRRENIIAFSASVASFEVLQLVAMVSGLLGLTDPGQQRYSYYPGNVRLERVLQCESVCLTPAFAAQGDYAHAGLGQDHALTALRGGARNTQPIIQG